MIGFKLLIDRKSQLSCQCLDEHSLTWKVGLLRNNDQNIKHLRKSQRRSPVVILHRKKILNDDESTPCYKVYAEENGF